MSAPECFTASFQFQPPLWQEFTLRGGAVLVVGHGTRNPAGAAQLLQLVTQMQQLAPNAEIRGCFLELATPSIEETISQLASQQVNQILVVPILLFTAAHAKDDIPNAVQSAADSYGIKVLGQTQSLGTDRAALLLSAQRFHEVAQLESNIACPAGACARADCPQGVCRGLGTKLGKIGLAMAGRGTSDVAALNNMRCYTKLHAAELQIPTFETGFFAGGSPSIDELLQLAASWDCESVVVQPHLLFEGELIQQLRRKVIQFQQVHPYKNWLIARTLGADPQLAQVFLSFAQQQLAPDHT